MKIKAHHIASACGLVVFLAAGIVYQLLPSPIPARLENQAYVWQTRWNDEVLAAIDRASPVLDGFMLLSGEVDYDGKNFLFSPAYPTPKAGGKPVTMVLRVKTRFSNALSSGKGIEAKNFLTGLLSPIAQLGATPAPGPRIQIDYDCPTGALQDYGGLLKGIRSTFPGAVLSITALPDWLKSVAFSGICANLDYFVLQVHALERPITFDAPYTLCDAEKARAAVRQAERFGRRFYIALPTYTYRLVFNEKGTFQTIGAEQSPEFPAVPGQTRDVAADPEKTAGLVREWHVRPPRNCLGLVWFRLPVDSDRFNLRWPAFEKLLRGETPKFGVTPEIRTPSPGLYELWLVNSGDYTPAEGLQCMVRWNPTAILAYDVIGGYRAKPGRDANHIVIHGVAPCENAQPVLAAWFRVKSEFNNNKDAVQCGPVFAQ
jgi:hypothetical protein